MPFHGIGGTFLSLFVKSQLNGFIPVGLIAFDLGDDARTSFDNSAWNIFSLGTENGSHSDFFSN
jgi:hypothetical protein